MRLTSKPLAALVIAILFGGIFFSSALGWWQTESSKQAAVYTEGEYAGQSNPADIRGSYTFGDVEKNFGISPALLAQAFGVQDADPAAFSVKGLEAIYADSLNEIGTASVRLFVAFYLGLPMDLSTDTYLPETAAAILRERNLSAERAAYLNAHTVPNLGAEDQPVETAAAPAGDGPATTEAAAEITPEHTPSVAPGTVVGKTTFAQLLEWGLKAETIKQVLGMPLPPAPGMTVKDFCAQNGLSFETIKPALQAEVDKLK